jgi:hypothetical protein
MRNVILIVLTLSIFSNDLYCQEGKITSIKVVKIDGHKFRFEVYFGQTISHLKIYKRHSGNWRLFQKHDDYFSDLKVFDYDKDGFKDIHLNTMGNNDSQELYLYSPRTQKFKFIENFIQFPSAKAIYKNYYYSYHRSGCADDFWTSDLFKIEDFKAIKIGSIAGNECQDPKGIDIYKIKNGEKILFEKRSIKDLNKFKDVKWGFIKRYWKKNWEKFKIKQ